MAFTCISRVDFSNCSTEERKRRWDSALDAQLEAFETIHPIEHPFDWATARAAHLQSALSIINGEGFEEFSNCHEDLRRDFVSLMASLSDEIVQTLQIAVHKDNRDTRRKERRGGADK
jgi:hypothetical protein